MKKRPLLTSDISIDDFLGYYWLKKELVCFCSQHLIPTSGNKADLTARISYFIRTKDIPTIKRKPYKSATWDSKRPLTLTTPVVYYKNDAATRAFFKQHLGPRFTFNGYLRAFATQKNDGSLTYQDLVDGYRQSLQQGKSPIGEQFEYNQFTRDFYANSPDKTREACLQAWKLVKAAPGGCTYKDYLKLYSDSDQ